MKRIVLQILALMAAAHTLAAGTADLVDDAFARAILDKKCIRLGTAEILPIQFQTAVSVMERPDLVTAAQEAFAASISESGQVDFPVIVDAPGTYHYIDANGRRVTITELYRKQTDEGSFDFVTLASSKRFLGGYDVVIHLQVIDLGKDQILYCVKTHAYPHNWFTRVSARDIGITKKHYKKRMKSLSWVARAIALELCEAEEFRKTLVEGWAPSRPADAKDDTAVVPPSI